MISRWPAPPPPTPMPEIRGALLAIDDAREALNRRVWHKAQLQDMIRSAEFHLARAKAAASITEQT